LSNKEWIEFLEAKSDNPNTPETNEGKGPALCASSEDFARVKTVIEQLCEAKNSQCRFEEVNQVFKRLEKIRRR
jgi:hypothetical protein